MPKVKKIEYETVELSFEEMGNLLRQALGLDKEFEFRLRHNGDVLWEYKIQGTLTKTTETK